MSLWQCIRHCLQYMIFGKYLEMCRCDFTPFSMPETEHVEMCQMVVRCYCNLISALWQLELLKVYTLLEGVIKGTVIKLLFFLFHIFRNLHSSCIQMKIQILSHMCRKFWNHLMEHFHVFTNYLSLQLVLLKCRQL